MLKQGLDVIAYLDKEYNTHLYNMKPSNIFIDGKNIWKFADFG